MTIIRIINGQIFRDGSFEAGDITIEDGLITESASGTEDQVIDANGLYVAPGFIDLHCHIFDHPDSLASRLSADRIGVRQGVCALIDTGSAGANLIDEFKPHVIDTQETVTFALCNIGSPGAPGSESGHASRPELLSLEGTVRAIERHRDWILGVKVLASASHSGIMGLDAVKIARKAAELTGVPLMVHLGNPPPIIDDVLELMRPGDIVTHAYHGKPGGVLGYQDRIIPAFREAVARGVWVDIAHGRSSFSYETCRKALDQGMPVHTISSDLHRGNVDRYVVSLARTMSKFRALGFSLEDVIQRVTTMPARVLGLEDFGLGAITSGKPARLTLFRETDHEEVMEDALGEKLISRTWIEPLHAIVGDSVFDVTEQL